MSKVVLRLLSLALVCAALVAASASGGVAASSKPTRISASFDFVARIVCPGGGTLYGHVELVAYDDDQTPITTSGDRQNDRVSMTVTQWDEYSHTSYTYSPDVLGVEVREDGSVRLAVVSWGAGYTLYDGGSPGSRLTGEEVLGLPLTLDWMTYKGSGTSCSIVYTVTSGNITIK